jgi:L-ascorbate metabolism protein UlaG (beta-lactamase superfamily)
LSVSSQPGAACYLKPDVKIEPLVFRWPVWPHLLAPATCAMNVAFRHLPGLQSFIKNPAVHAAAAKDPAMLGSSFLCLPQSATAAARALSQATTERCSALLAFAQGYKQLDSKLATTAKGFRLDDFYRDLPEPLTGTVELVYDLNNRPRIKIIEELLYEALPVIADSREVCLRRIPQSERSFFMSTPMLDAADCLFLRLDFHDPRIDELTSMRIEPGSGPQLAGRLGVESSKMSLFNDLFTSEPPSRLEPAYVGDQVRLRYFGHACVLLQTAEVSVLIDPLTAWERDRGEASLTFNDLPDFIDYVVISHPHADHLVAEVLLQLRSRVGSVVVPRNDRGNLADPSVRLIMRELGFTRVHALEPFESLQVPDGQILALPFIGEHAGLDIMSKSSFAISLKGRTCLFLVDSDAVEPVLYRRLARRIGKVDALFIGMECHGAPLTWLYGPLLPGALSRRDDDSRRLSGSDCARAWGVVEELDCSRVFVYAMGQEPWLKHLMGLAYQPGSVQLTESDKFLERCRAEGIPAERLYGCREMLL